MVILFSDIVGSTALKTQVGVQAYSRLLARHDEIFRQVVSATAGAQILKDLGDGYLVSFQTPSDAVRAALLLQQSMQDEQWPAGPIKIRLGIHLGELIEIQEEDGREAKLAGLAVDVAAHLASLAQGGQILLTRAAFNEARQFVSEHPKSNGEQSLKITWVAHSAIVPVLMTVNSCVAGWLMPRVPKSQAAGARLVTSKSCTTS